MSLFLQMLFVRGILSGEQEHRLEEFHMKKILIQYGICALAVALMVPLAEAQPAGIQAAFGKDAATLSDKFTGLARVMSGKYDWKPGPGVRSVGDVFNLIVKENGLLAGVLSGTPNTEAKLAPITDPEKLQEALKASYVNLQKAITALSDNDLQAPVKLFGRDMTKLGAVMLILEDQHEHLGQSIAYARSNGVVPPWSK
ncbi:MAG TPA: DinB family protein [Terriglobales bacterium]